MIFFYSKSLDLREIHNMLGGLLAIKLHNRSEHTSLRLQKNSTSYPKIPSTLNRWLPSTHNRCQVHTSTHNRWLPTHDRWWKHTLSVQNPIRLAKKLVFKKMGCHKYLFDKRWRKNKAGISINNRSEKNCLILSSTSFRMCIDSIEVRLKFSLTRDTGIGKKVY